MFFFLETGCAAHCWSLLCSDRISFERIRVPTRKGSRATCKVPHSYTIFLTLLRFIKWSAVWNSFRDVFTLVSYLRENDIAHNVFATRGKRFAESVPGSFDTLRVYVWAREPAFGILDLITVSLVPFKVKDILILKVLRKRPDSSLPCANSLDSCSLKVSVVVHIIIPTGFYCAFLFRSGRLWWGFWREYRFNPGRGNVIVVPTSAASNNETLPLILELFRSNFSIHSCVFFLVRLFNLK